MNGIIYTNLKMKNSGRFVRIFQKCLVISSISFILSVSGDKNGVTLSGKTYNLFLGDYELYECSASKSEFKNLTWNYLYPDGSSASVISAEMKGDKIFDKPDSDRIIRKSLIKIHGKTIQKIQCSAYSHDGKIIKTANSDLLDILDHTPIDALSEPSCDSDPKIIMTRWDSAFKSEGWSSHYINGSEVTVPNGIGEASGIKLTCLAREKVKWIIKKKDLKWFSYWTSEPTGEDNKCFSAVLILNPLTSESAQQYICGKDKDGRKLSVVFVETRNHPGQGFDFNKTQECIEHLGTTVFGSQTLGWTATGTSALSIGMMVGIVFLKKQLNKQKEQGAQP